MKTLSKIRLHRIVFQRTSLLTVLLFVVTALSACFVPRKERVPLKERIRERRENRQSRDQDLNSLPPNQSESSSGSQCNAIVPPPENGYGSIGSYSVSETVLPHPAWDNQSVYVFYPEGLNKAAPTIFFSHALNAAKPDIYSALIENIVSQGYVLVYSPYPGQKDDTKATVGSRYNTLRSGFDAAVQSYGQMMDTSKVGFMGHSFGGGATPSIAYRGLVENGWGNDGSFIFIMAPWYATEISVSQLNQIPSSTKVIVQVYEEDTVNDHRIAIDLFKEFDVSEKQYILLESDRSFSQCSLIADHGVPASIGREGSRVNALDYYGVFRVVDALADYAFTGSPEGQQLIFGDDDLRFMGNWPNGQGVVQAQITQSPVPSQNEAEYRFSASESKSYIDQ